MSPFAVIIPAKNEAATIRAVAASVAAYAPEATVIIVDDNSTDETMSEAKKAKGVIIVHSAVTLGIGGAVQLGIKSAMRLGIDVCVRMDGDGQHDARFIGQLVSKVSPGSIVVGSRTRTWFFRCSDPVRFVGSVFFRILFRLFTGARVKDPTSGFVCFGKDVSRQFCKYFPTEYPEIESSVLLLRAGYSIVTVPVEMMPRCGGHSSITVFRSMVYMVSVTIAFFVSFFRKNPYRK